MCMSICQGCPAFEISTDTSPSRRQRTKPGREPVAGRPPSGRRAPLPSRPSAWSASAIPCRASSRPRWRSGHEPKEAPIKACWRCRANPPRSSLSMLIPGPQMHSVRETGGDRLRIHGEPDAGVAKPGQAVMWSGLTTRSDGIAVILTIAASAEAAASDARSLLDHGGNATAMISVPGRTCNDSASTATELAISNAAALSQTGHRKLRWLCPAPLHGTIRVWN